MGLRRARMVIRVDTIFYDNLGVKQMGFLNKKKTPEQKLQELKRLRADIKKEEKEQKRILAEQQKIPIPPKKFFSSNTTPQQKTGEAEPRQTEEFKPLTKRKRFGFFGKLKIKFAPSTTFLIHMEFSNGTMKNFILKSSKETFTYKGRMYYLRYEDSLYHLTHSLYELRYHEDYAVPIDRKIINKPDPNNKANPTAYFSVSSHNLAPLIKMEYVKALAEAQELTKYLKLGLIVSLIVLVGVIFNGIQLYRLAPLG